MKEKNYITKSYENRVWLKNINIIIQPATNVLEIEKVKFMNILIEFN